MSNTVPHSSNTLHSFSASEVGAAVIDAATLLFTIPSEEVLSTGGTRALSGCSSLLRADTSLWALLTHAGSANTSGNATTASPSPTQPHPIALVAAATAADRSSKSSAASLSLPPHPLCVDAVRLRRVSLASEGPLSSSSTPAAGTSAAATLFSCVGFSNGACVWAVLSVDATTTSTTSPLSTDASVVSSGVIDFSHAVGGDDGGSSSASVVSSSPSFTPSVAVTVSPAAEKDALLCRVALSTPDAHILYAEIHCSIRSDTSTAAAATTAVANVVATGRLPLRLGNPSLPTHPGLFSDIRRVAWTKEAGIGQAAHPLLAVLHCARSPSLPVCQGDEASDLPPLQRLSLCLLQETRPRTDAALAPQQQVHGHMAEGPWGLRAVTLAHPSFFTVFSSTVSKGSTETLVGVFVRPADTLFPASALARRRGCDRSSAAQRLAAATSLAKATEGGGADTAAGGTDKVERAVSSSAVCQLRAAPRESFFFGLYGAGGLLARCAVGALVESAVRLPQCADSAASTAATVPLGRVAAHLSNGELVVLQAARVAKSSAEAAYQVTCLHRVALASLVPPSVAVQDHPASLWLVPAALFSPLSEGDANRCRIWCVTRCMTVVGAREQSRENNSGLNGSTGAYEYVLSSTEWTAGGSAAATPLPGPHILLDTLRRPLRAARDLLVAPDVGTDPLVATPAAHVCDGLARVLCCCCCGVPASASPPTPPTTAVAGSMAPCATAMLALLRDGRFVLLRGGDHMKSDDSGDSVRWLSSLVWPARDQPCAAAKLSLCEDAVDALLGADGAQVCMSVPAFGSGTGAQPSSDYQQTCLPVLFVVYQYVLLVDAASGLLLQCCVWSPKPATAAPPVPPVSWLPLQLTRAPPLAAVLAVPPSRPDSFTTNYTISALRLSASPPTEVPCLCVLQVSKHVFQPLPSALPSEQLPHLEAEPFFTLSPGAAAAVESPTGGALPFACFVSGDSTTSESTKTDGQCCPASLLVAAGPLIRLAEWRLCEMSDGAPACVTLKIESAESSCAVIDVRELIRCCCGGGGNDSSAAAEASLWTSLAAGGASVLYMQSLCEAPGQTLLVLTVCGADPNAHSERAASMLVHVRAGQTENVSRLEWHCYPLPSHSGGVVVDACQVMSPPLSSSSSSSSSYSSPSPCAVPTGTLLLTVAEDSSGGPAAPLLATVFPSQLPQIGNGCSVPAGAPPSCSFHRLDTLPSDVTLTPILGSAH